MLLRGRRGHRKDARWMWKPRGNNVHKYSRNLLLLILPKIRFMQYYQYISYGLKINVHYTTHPQSYIYRTRKCDGAEKKISRTYIQKRAFHYLWRQMKCFLAKNIVLLVVVAICWHAMLLLMDSITSKKIKIGFR